MSTRIIGIAGASGSGKTTLARGLANRIGGVPVIGLDSYYRDYAGVDDADLRVDEPGAIEHGLLIRHLRELVAGRAIDAPVYDYVTHSRTTETVTVPPARYVIIEGLFALYWSDLRTLLFLSVFIAAPDEVCLSRRIARDTMERGRSAGSIVHAYEQVVRPNFERYVAPTAAHAAMHLQGTMESEDLVNAVVAVLQK